MADDQSDSLGARLIKLFDPSYDLTGKKKDSDEQINTEAGRKYMDAQFAEEQKRAAGRKKLADRTLGGKKAAKKKAAKKPAARKRD